MVNVFECCYYSLNLMEVFVQIQVICYIYDHYH